MKKLFAIFSFCALLFAGCAQPSNQQVLNQQPSDQPTSTQELDRRLENGNPLPPGAAEKKEMNDNIVTREAVSYMIDNIKVKGYLAMPKDAKNLPAVILIHEWWGLNDNMKDMANKFAEQGYVALAVDLYDGQVATVAEDAQKLAGSVRENMDPAFKNLGAAVEYLKGLPEVDKDRIASVGWCFGGGWAYQMAKNDMGVKATVMYYGQFSEEDDLSHMKSTIIGHFGEEDTGIKVDTVKEFQATLKTLSGNHEVYIYPNAGHGFANPDNPNYNQEAADTAWERTMAFLGKYL